MFATKLHSARLADGTSSLARDTNDYARARVHILAKIFPSEISTLQSESQYLCVRLSGAARDRELRLYFRLDARFFLFRLVFISYRISVRQNRF